MINFHNQLLYLFFLLIGLLVGLLIQPFLFKSSSETDSSNDPVKENMILRGIHPDPVTILEIAAQAQWQTDAISYNLEKVYLTPDIADFGSARNNQEVKGKSFLSAKLNIRDIRIDGERRLINLSNHLRLRKNNQDQSPFLADYLYLMPQENGTVYVTFAVEKDEKQFTLLIGDLATPRLINLNFEATETTTLTGVFLRKQGYAESFQD
mgnify:CR=1 FL=1